MAIEKAYRERSGGFLAWAMRHAPDAEDAEDALQEAFLRALANADALGVIRDAAGWIFSVMRNRIVDLWRGRDAQRRAGAVDLPEETFREVAVAVGVDPYDALLRGEIEEALAVAMDALPAVQREALRAQTLEGTTFRELSERTGIPIDTIMARKRRAVRKLAAALQYWMED